MATRQRSTSPAAADENAYQALASADPDPEARWAFGTGFDDPLATVATDLPLGVDGPALAAYCVDLADDALIMSQRLTGWVTDAPELEEEVALANIALDLLGEARLLYTRAAQVSADVEPRDEDSYAYCRAPGEFRNVHLVEQADDDFAWCITRLLVFSTWRLALAVALQEAADPVLAAIAAKAVKEVSYHREYAVSWTLRLGDGTPESHHRMQTALAGVLPLLPEALSASAPRDAGSGVKLNVATIGTEVDSVLATVMSAAGLELPEVTPAACGGRRGRHTEGFDDLVTTMQEVARAHPGAIW